MVLGVGGVEEGYPEKRLFGAARWTGRPASREGYLNRHVGDLIMPSTTPVSHPPPL